MTELVPAVDGLFNAYSTAQVGSPEWWLRRLHGQIANRIPSLDLFDAYYGGDHPLPWLPRQAQAEFRRILAMTRSNFCGLVVDATAERLQVEGFRLPGEERADAETWRLWQYNNLDDDADKAILEALIGGTSYTLVEPNGDTPNIYVEHASQAVVEYEPGSNRRRKAAGLKLWVDDWTGRLNATLFLPDWVYKFESEAPKSGALDHMKLTWHPRLVRNENWPARNTLGEVPLTELPNNPRLRTGGVSELDDVIDIQDRINKTIADRLITQDFGAFPQKWAVGYPDEDADGNPAEPIDIGRDRVVTTDVAKTEAAFGQWDSAPLDPYNAAKREDVKDIASRTRTPAQYLLGEMSNVNGETLKASESGLVAKVRQRQRPFEGGLVQTMVLARKAAGLPVPEARMSAIWRNPEFRTEGETTDAGIKQLAAGLRDRRGAQEFIGMSQSEIAAQDEREATLDPVAERLARQFTAGTVGMSNATTASDV